MNNIKIFNHEEFGQVRILTINNEPWLVGKDVAEILGYSDTNQAIRKHVDEEDKLTSQFNGSGQNRNMTVISESGLYSLIISSKLPSAKKFKRWVTSEVLPSIRKHGMYATDELLADPDLLFQVVTQLKEEIEKRKQEIEKRKQLELTIIEQQPKIEYFNEVLESDELLTTTTIAKDLNMSALQLNKILKGLRVIYKQGSLYHLYAQYYEQGLVHYKTCKKGDTAYMYWTQKGRHFVINLLNDTGVISHMGKVI